MSQKCIFITEIRGARNWLFLVLTLTGFTISAQIQNGSFENWSDTSGSNLPIGWQASTADTPLQDSFNVKAGIYSTLLKPVPLLDTYTTPGLLQFFTGLNGKNDTLYFWLDASDTIKKKQKMFFRFRSKGYQPQDTIEWYLSDTITQGYELFKIPLNFSQKPDEVRFQFWLYTEITTKNPGSVRIDDISLNENPLNSESISETEIVVYPVPAHNRLRIKGVPEEDLRKLRFYNLQGQSISVPKVAGDSWQVEHLKPGIYFVEIPFQSGERILRRFVLD